MADEPNEAVVSPSESSDGTNRETGVNKSPSCDGRLFNIILLGFAFMLIFTAFQTCSNVEQLVLEGVTENGTGTESVFGKGSGYTSLAIIYGVFATSNWLAPSVIAVITAKWAMVLGGVLFSLFIASFLRPMHWSLYTGSVLLGFAAAIIWTGQGSFLTLNSDVQTVGRNSGIFWALLQCSLLIGNLLVYFVFGDQDTIDENSRTDVFIPLTAACVVGVLALIPLRTSILSRSSQRLTELGDSQRSEAPKAGPLSALKQSLKLFLTKQMFFLSFPFAYTGFELTFFSGVYGTVVGHTLTPKDTGLIGVCIGAGEILGGSVFGLLGKRTIRFGRDPIVLLGCLIHMAAFYLIFLCFPSQSPVEEIKASVHHNVYIEPHLYLALTAAFLLGLGDSSYNTQIYSLLGDVFSTSSAPAFALFKFVQSLAAAIAFSYSRFLHLQWQLLILAVFNVIGLLGFCVVEWSASRPTSQGYSRL